MLPYLVYIFDSRGSLILTGRERDPEHAARTVFAAVRDGRWGIVITEASCLISPAPSSVKKKKRRKRSRK